MDGLIMDMNRFSSAIFVDMVQKITFICFLCCHAHQFNFIEVQP